MDPEFLTAFIEEADGLLRSIRSSILVFLKDGGSVRELEMPLQAIQSLKDAATVLDQHDIEADAARMEKRLKRLIYVNEPLSEEEARGLLDLLAEIEATVMNFGMKNDSSSMDVSMFVDESFDILQIDAAPAAAPAQIAAPVNILASFLPPQKTHTPVVVEESADDEFEIDAEMLEIFAMEAEDLLKNIDTALDVLAKQPDDRDALWEIRRNAHTFKGAAGIVGLKKPSALAHRVEDLLDYLAENGIGPTREIFDLLISSTDCLKSITSGDNSPQVAAQINKIYGTFDSLMLSLTTPPAEIKPAVKKKAAAPKPVTALDALPEEEAQFMMSDDIEENVPQRPAHPRSIVRVSLSRLDDLVKIVRDLVVSRSVFEQRLSEFERQIEELHNSTRRLQSTSSQLEINFEASMMGSAQSLSTVLPSGTTGAFEHFDPLEFDRYTEFHQTTRELAETTSDTFAINTALDVVKENLGSLFDSQRRLIEDMQEKLMRIRMVEFGTLATRLTRTVRVTCDEEGKLADVLIENQDQEIDTQVLDGLIEPLMHLLRNAVVHGIEPAETRRLLGKSESGLIRLRMINEETHVVLKISDDGRGIAASSLKEKAFLTGLITRERADSMSYEEVLDLIFLPGLTTADKLSLSAGRGVGMSIVRESIESRDGTISIESAPQKGTTFTIRMPLPLAVTNVLLVKVNRQTFALPLKLIRHIGDITAANISGSGSAKIVELATGKYPLKQLDDYVGFSGREEINRDQITVLLVETSDITCALMVDEIIKSEEIVIKSLGKPLDSINGLLGAAILANGDTVPILDLPLLLKTKSTSQMQVLEIPVEPAKLCVMVVDDSPSVRHMTSKIIENAGWTVVTSKDGLEAMEMLQSGAKHPDIILTDVEMPRMDGYELVSTITKNASLNKIPMVFITSRAGDKHRDRATALGIKEYLTKPFEESELLATVKRLTH